MLAALRKRCAHPDAMPGSVCQWPPGTAVTWHLGDQTDDVVGAVADGIGRWSGVCGVSIERVTDPALARVVVTFTPIDGPGNVLGLTDLPCGATAASVMQLRLDPSETWTWELLAECACHEFGHALGLGHAPVPDVMDAYLDRTQTSPGPWSTAEAQLRYGPPAPAAEPAPAPAPPAEPGPAAPAPPAPVSVEFTVPEAGTYVFTLSLVKQP